MRTTDDLTRRSTSRNRLVCWYELLVAWDATRTVPWRRLVREWLVYVAIMSVVFMVFMNDRPIAGILAGLLASGPLYLVFGYVLAKFGYQRKTFKQARSGQPQEPASGSPEDEPDGPRPKAPPTSRTGGGGSRPGGNRKRR